MNSTFTPTGHTGPTSALRDDRSRLSDLPRPIVRGLSAIVAVGAVALIVALMAGATVLFNVVVFALFGLLWISFAAALIRAPQTLNDLWYRTRQLPLVIQAIVWLLFLPLMIALWIWVRNWSLPVRLVLVFGMGFTNLFMFLPRSL